MTRSQDIGLAIFLLLVSGILFLNTFDIDSFEMLAMGADVWPRIVIVILGLLSVILLVQTLRRPIEAERRKPIRVLDLLAKYRNPLWCYGIFAVYLLTLEFLGMLLGTILLVFSIMTSLGPQRPRAYAINALIAITSVGLMWAIFSYGLMLYMPEGEILRLW